MSSAGMPRRILFYEPDPVRKGDLVHYECGDAWSAGIVVGVRTLRQGMEVLIIGERGIVGAPVRQVKLEARAE